MLHKVRVSVCHEHLTWIVNLQLNLLQALCYRRVSAAQVTKSWVAARLPHIPPAWIETFCASYKPRQQPRVTMLQHMQAIAAFPPSVKTTLLNSFRHDLQVLADLERGQRPGRTMQSIAAIGDQHQQATIRAFFELFYEPNFDKGKGYPLVAGENTPRFDREQFVERFKEENESTAVCPLCDGKRGIAQVDHFYPKSFYPFLSCHPLNLIPICKDCNMAPAKGNKLPLNSNVANNQMEDWFHPIFEPLADWSDRAQHPIAEQFRVGFQRVDGRTTPVPTSDDQRIKARLENLDNLTGLNKRWRDELKAEYIGALRNIQQYRRTKGRSMTEEELVIRLESWAEDAQSRIGVRPHAILGYFYNHVAAQRDPQLFLELWIENTGADPLTGE